MAEHQLIYFNTTQTRTVNNKKKNTMETPEKSESSNFGSSYGGHWDKRQKTTKLIWFYILWLLFIIRMYIKPTEKTLKLNVFVKLRLRHHMYGILYTILTRDMIVQFTMYSGQWYTWQAHQTSQYVIVNDFWYIRDTVQQV